MHIYRAGSNPQNTKSVLTIEKELSYSKNL